MRAILFAVLLLSSCAHRRPPPPHVMATPYVAAHHDPFRANGTAAITGQAFTKTRGGDVKPCAGEEVLLIPATPYLTEWADYALIREEKISGVEHEAHAVIRKTTSDGAGNFMFEALPDGEYIITCAVFWEVPSSYYAGPYLGVQTIMQKTGSVVFGRAIAAQGRTTKVIVSR